MAGFLAACLPIGGSGPTPGRPTGAEDFASYCAGCHGATGKGYGEAAAGLSERPANLTTIAARNDGSFPMTRVMAHIWGYAQEDGRVMPKFAPLLDGDLVLFDGGDGIATPTPLRLVQLGQYVQSLQGS
ncbi:MAG: cytochrome C [Cereibacter sphaeroides]|uniref:Cytochrome C n=1 Tax=Cereibacter sphaeroides TaxID=1063 RepID=A0A2W5SD54_CERSP|nr:MAG: cytochrome C [Cereibacter sphaeroides]